MLFRSLVQSTLALLPSDKCGSCNDSTSLRGGQRRLVQSDLPECLGGTIDLFYNANFTIECANEIENCTDDDFDHMGLLLEHFVGKIEKDYPSYKQEFINTKVCPIPIAENSTTAEEGDSANDTTPDLRRLGHSNDRKLVQEKERRRIKRFSYTSGGHCRRCKADKIDRRLAASPMSEAELMKEAASEACSHVDTAVFAGSVAQEGFEICDSLVNDIEELALGYNQANVAEQYVEEVRAMHENCKQLEYKARTGAEDTKDWCALATNIAGNSMEAEQCAQKAETCSNYAMEAAKNIQSEIGNLRKKKVELKKLILHQNFEIQTRELDALIDAESRNKKILESEMDEQIAQIEDKLRLAQANSTANELEKKKAALEQMKKEQQERSEERAKEIQQMKIMYENLLDFQMKEASILLEMEDATNVNEWLSEFAHLLEHKLPGLLLESYNTTLNEGCLETEPIVTVNIEEKETYAETNKNQCPGRTD